MVAASVVLAVVGAVAALPAEESQAATPALHALCTTAAAPLVQTTDMKDKTKSQRDGTPPAKQHRNQQLIT